MRTAASGVRFPERQGVWLVLPIHCAARGSLPAGGAFLRDCWLTNLAPMQQQILRLFQTVLDASITGVDFSVRAQSNVSTFGKSVQNIIVRHHVCLQHIRGIKIFCLRGFKQSKCIQKEQSCIWRFQIDLKNFFNSIYAIKEGITV